MKSLFLAVTLVLVTPSLAHAEVAMTVRDVPLHDAARRGVRTLAATKTVRFNMVGLHWQGTGSVSFRTRSLAGTWSRWRPAAPEAEDGPDRPVDPAWRLGNPYWTNAADAIAYRTYGRVTRLRAYLLWSPVDDLPSRHLSIAGSPQIIPRAAWGADESIRRAPPRYADAVRFALVHHTAGATAYSPTQSAAIVRGIEVYHVKGNGWNDIGYNFLVDKYGQVFEGRFGGVDKNVIGAHAEGFNTGSVGVAVIGTYTDAAPPKVAITALENLLAWRLDVAHVDPLSTVMVASGGNAKFPQGVPVLLRAISGHRDTGFTSCPGNALYAQLGAIAGAVAAEGLPKLYEPTVTGQPGGPVEFKARLSAPLPWTVAVTDPTGAVVATGSGSSSDIDWTWDASSAPPARYAWTISAGSDVLPASGFVGAAPVPLALKSPSAKPAAISPNGDGIADSATIAYTLTVSATVTVVLGTPDGRQLETLFSEQRTRGRHTFSFTAQSVPDGQYELVITATDGKTTVSTTLPVLVDRTVDAPKLSPVAISPNGDGRNDALNVTFQLTRAAHVRVDVKQASRVVATPLAADLGPGQQTVVWNGMASGTRVPDGTYAAVLTATSPLGTTSYPLRFRIDTVAPRLRAISFRRLVFFVSKAARVTARVNGQTSVTSVRAGVFRLPRAGAPRRLRIFAMDDAGNVSPTLRYP